MNENSLLYAAAGIIIAVFGLIIFLAIDATTEEDIEIDPQTGQVPGFEQMREFREEAKDRIQNNEVMSRFKGFFDDSSDSLKKKVDDGKKQIPNETSSQNNTD